MSENRDVLAAFAAFVYSTADVVTYFLYGVIGLASGVTVAHLVTQVFSYGYSPERSASRAARSGHLGAALRFYAEAGSTEHVRELAEHSLPAMAREPLLTSVEEFVVLEKAADLARRRGLRLLFAWRLGRQISASGEVLARTIDRIAGLRTTGLSPSAQEARSKYHLARIDPFVGAMRLVSNGLRDLGAPAGKVSLDELETRLRRLASAARTLREG